MSNIGSVDSSSALQQSELRTTRQAEDQQAATQQVADKQVQQAEDRVDLSAEAQRINGARGEDAAESNDRIESRSEERVARNQDAERAAQAAQSEEGGSANDVAALLNSGQGESRLGNNIDTAV